jgi:hypothetical protein
MTLDEAKAVVIAKVTSFGGDGMNAVDDVAVVAELRRTGLSAAKARMLGREAVAELGGYIEHGEVWSIPATATGRGRARAA